MGGRSMGADIIKLNDDTYRIEDGDIVRCFLLIGDKEALLIDSCMTFSNAREIAEGLTDRPIKHMITHADGDHLGGLASFTEVYMSENELAHFCEHPASADIEAIFISEGDSIDLGNRVLEFIELPGHTPGSIAILDTKYRVLISGDPIQDGDVYMFGPFRDMSAYIKSLEHLMTQTARFDFIYPSHVSFPLPPEVIGEIHDAAILVNKANGNAIDGYDAPEIRDMWGAKALAYNIDGFHFLMEVKDK